jgi:hypothetical protein
VRFKTKRKIPNQIITREYFAIFPVYANCEWRWLERVKVEGYWWLGSSDTWYWEPERFIDDEVVIEEIKIASEEIKKIKE